MSTPVHSRGRAATESAILRSAWTLWAGCGPDGVPLRKVTAEAGCTHTLVARYFGSKDGLVDAVSALVAERVDGAVRAAWCADADPFLQLLASARREPDCTRLLVRCGLGDLRVEGVVAALGLDRLAAGTRGGAPSRRRRLVVYGTASLLLGWLTFEDFLVGGTGARVADRRRLDHAVAERAQMLLDLTRSSSPSLLPRRLAPYPATPSVTAPVVGARERLLDAAMALLAERGPSSVSLRDVAGRAGVNLGLIHRHFGSREALVAAAIEQGGVGTYPGANDPSGFDLDEVSRALHAGSPAPFLLARTAADGIPITQVRQRFPVLDRLLEASGDRSGRPPGLPAADPLPAAVSIAALGLGSALWGPQLRGPLDLAPRGIDSAMADLARVLLRG